MKNNKDEKKKKKKKLETTTGYFENNLPYTRMGDNPRILIDLEALSYINAPPSGYMLKEFIKTHKLLAKEFTIYLVGRKPNLLQGYSMKDMADDYAEMIKMEFGGPVDIMGYSTGGQIAHFLAADHPDVVRKLIIISAAYRLSDKGVDTERIAAEFAKQGKYNKSVSAIINLVYPPGLKKSILKFMARLFGKHLMGCSKDSSDFLVMVEADRNMNFKDRLSEIKTPTLVMSGELDEGYTADLVRETAEGIPNAELILYKGYAHNLTIDNTEKVQQDILEFLKKEF